MRTGDGPSEMIILLNDKRQVIGADIDSLRRLGYGPEEIIGKDFEELVLPEDRQMIKDAIGYSGVEKKPLNCQISFIGKDGRRMKGAATISVIIREPEKPVFLVIAGEQSGEKQIGMELAQKNAELEDLQRELNSFISMTSHELRNPITNIEGFACLLEERIEDLSPLEIKEFTARINGNVRRLKILMEDLVLFSREKRREIECENVNLRSLMGEVIGQLDKKVKSTGADIEMNLAVETLCVDRQKLFQVMKNLVENSLTYHREGIAPLISIEAMSPEESFALFKVTDNGLGIPENERELIFGIFRRGSTSNGKQGTGVGLALIKENVTRMGGRIWLESKPGSGSTFFFRLPISSC